MRLLSTLKTEASSITCRPTDEEELPSDAFAMKTRFFDFKDSSEATPGMGIEVWADCII